MSELKAKKHEGWLDKLAISMAVLCAIHCLIVPVLIVAVPLISTTFFVHENFHLVDACCSIPDNLGLYFIGL
jgi:hypothetical protein